MQRNEKDRIIFQQKWLQINKEIMHRKLISNTKTLELENLGNILYETECKWESKIKNHADWKRRRNIIKCKYR
jgi:hypothetical protein